LIWFIWSVWFNQTNETDQINKRDQPVFALHTHGPWTLADFFNSLLGNQGEKEGRQELCSQ
jgi:hypothetical protein